MSLIKCSGCGTTAVYKFSDKDTSLYLCNKCINESVYVFCALCKSAHSVQYVSDNTITQSMCRKCYASIQLLPIE